MRSSAWAVASPSSRRRRSLARRTPNWLPAYAIASRSAASRYWKASRWVLLSLAPRCCWTMAGGSVAAIFWSQSAADLTLRR